MIPVSTAFTDLLPTGVIVVESEAARDPASWAAELLPEEEPHVARATGRRRREFTAGRTCARAALARLGLVPGVIAVGPKREPVFPPEVSGSITHTGEYCAAAVARVGALRTLGIDAEANRPLEAGVASRILDVEERAHVRSQSPVGCAGEAIFFSVKEAFFKAVFPLCQRHVDFDEVSLRWRPDGAGCRVHLRDLRLVELLSGLDIDARVRFDAFRVYSAVTLMNSHAASAQPLLASCQP